MESLVLNIIQWVVTGGLFLKVSVDSGCVEGVIKSFECGFYKGK